MTNKKAPAIRSHYTRQTFKGVENKMPSKTVPDQALSIRDIINRTQKGLPVTGVKVPIYNETEHGLMPDLRNMDISEIADLKKRIKQTEDRIRKDLAKQEEERRLQETEEYYKKKFTPKQPPTQPVEVDVEEVK